MVFFFFSLYFFVFFLFYILTYDIMFDVRLYCLFWIKWVQLSLQHRYRSKRIFRLCSKSYYVLLMSILAAALSAYVRAMGICEMNFVWMNIIFVVHFLTTAMDWAIIFSMTYEHTAPKHRNRISWLTRLTNQFKWKMTKSHLIVNALWFCWRKFVSQSKRIDQ